MIFLAGIIPLPVVIDVAQTPLRVGGRRK